MSHPTRWTAATRTEYARALLDLVDEYAAPPADRAAYRTSIAHVMGTRYVDRPAVRAHFLAMLGALIADARGADDLEPARVLFARARRAAEGAPHALATALNRACYPMLDDDTAPAAQRPTIAALRAVGDSIAHPVLVGADGATLETSPQRR